MSIFKGPGILLNRVTVQQPAHLPTLFNLALDAKRANLCAVRDELGAIAYSLHENGNPDKGNELFRILDEYKLVEKRDDILKCMECAGTQVLADALFRSGRYFKNFEIPRFKSGRSKKVSDIDLLEALCNASSQIEAAHALGVSSGFVSSSIAAATGDSLLGVFKGVFRRGHPRGPCKKRQRVSDDEIDAALDTYKTQTAAAASLGITVQAVSDRIARAPETSRLFARKGTFGHRRKDSLKSST